MAAKRREEPPERTPEGERWRETLYDPPRRVTVYFDRKPGRKRGRPCEILARLEGGIKYRVRILNPRKGERRERVISPLLFSPQPIDPFGPLP